MRKTQPHEEITQPADDVLVLFSGQTALMPMAVTSFCNCLHTFLHLTNFERCQNEEYPIHRYDQRQRHEKVNALRNFIFCKLNSDQQLVIWKH